MTSSDDNVHTRKTPLTVLFILPPLKEVMQERGGLDLVTAVVKAQGRALVATESGMYENRLKALHAEHIPLPTGRSGFFSIGANAKALISALGGQKVHVVHARGSSAVKIARAVAKKTGVPFVTSCHGHDFDGSPLSDAEIGSLLRADKTIIGSPYLADLLQLSHGLKDTQAVLIPHGIDPRYFSDEVVPPQRIAQQAAKWNLQDDPRPVFLMASPADDSNAHQHFAEAALALRQSHGAEFVALILGDRDDSALAKSIQRQISRAGAYDCISYVTRPDDIAAAFALASVIVNLSTYPPAWDRVSIEAHALGRPVIATRHGSSEDVVLDRETGWLIEPSDRGQLLLTMQTFLEKDVSARRHMGSAARIAIARSFPYEGMLSGTLALYEELADRYFIERTVM